jgi:hypothetical protein
MRARNHMRTHACIRTYAHLLAHTHAHASLCLRTVRADAHSAQPHTHARTRHTGMRARTRTQTCVRMRAHMHAHTHVRTRTHTRAHARNTILHARTRTHTWGCAAGYALRGCTAVARGCRCREVRTRSGAAVGVRFRPIGGALAVRWHGPLGSRHAVPPHWCYRHSPAQCRTTPAGGFCYFVAALFLNSESSSRSHYGFVTWTAGEGAGPPSSRARSHWMTH